MINPRVHTYPSLTCIHAIKIIPAALAPVCPTATRTAIQLSQPGTVSKSCVSDLFSWLNVEPHRWPVMWGVYPTIAQPIALTRKDESISLHAKKTQESACCSCLFVRTRPAICGG